MFWEDFGLLWEWDEQEYFGVSLDQTLIPNRRFAHLFLLCVISPSDIYIVSDPNCNHYWICDSVEVVDQIWYCWFVLNASKVFDEYIPSDVSKFVSEYHLEHTEWDYWKLLKELKNNKEVISQLSSISLKADIRSWWPVYAEIKWKTEKTDFQYWDNLTWEHSDIKLKKWKYWKKQSLEITKKIKIEKSLDNEISEQ